MEWCVWGQHRHGNNIITRIALSSTLSHYFWLFFSLRPCVSLLASPSPLLMRNISPPPSFPSLPPSFFSIPKPFYSLTHLPLFHHLNPCLSCPSPFPPCPVAFSFFNPFSSLIFPPSAAVPSANRLIYLFCSHIVRGAADIYSRGHVSSSLSLHAALVNSDEWSSCFRLRVQRQTPKNLAVTSLERSRAQSRFEIHPENLSGFLPKWDKVLPHWLCKIPLLHCRCIKHLLMCTKYISLFFFL